MSRARIIYVDPPRRLPRIAVMLAAIAAGTVAGAYWATAQTPHAEAPVQPASRAVAAAPAEPAAARPASTAAPASPLVTPAPLATAVPAAVSSAAPVVLLSTQVAPGVHVTPMSVPPGSVPMPAGPSETDSEPEN